MDEKKNDLFTVSILVVILAIFILTDLFNEERLFSEMENRMLAGKPKFTKENVLSGKYMEDYEEYLTDQFVSRDRWVELKTRMDVVTQKKEINGVYLGKNRYLIEQHLPEHYTAQMEDEKLAQLERLVEQWDAKVMLVPTADNVLKDKLPAYAVSYDQAGFLEKVRNQVGEENYIDVYSVLKEHKDEEIYYRTDHHWTALGTYYGYQAWADETLHFSVPYDSENMTSVSDKFQGTLHSKVPITNTVDTIHIFPESTMRKVSVTYDFNRTATSLYEEKHLDTKNQYAYFLDDNHAFIEIRTDYKTDRTLFLIKDSYANSMIPLLQPHYSTIYVLDPRYYNGSVNELMKKYEPEGGMDVIVLYNCVHFLEDFRY